MYAQKPMPLLPTFLGACLGSDARLSTAQQAFRDPQAVAAHELMVRLLRERGAYETNPYGENSLLLSAQIFPFFYALAGDRNPKADPRKQEGSKKRSPLARDVLSMLQAKGPLTKPRLAEELGGALSGAALDRALSELWGSLLITRVDYRPNEGAFWDVLYRWSPEAVKEGVGLSLAESLSALISKYLDCVAAAEASEVEAFFAPFVARSRVRESVNALLATREAGFVHCGHRTLLELAPPAPPRATIRNARASSGTHGG
jgi:hypothetical protein